MILKYARNKLYNVLQYGHINRLTLDAFVQHLKNYVECMTKMV